MNNIEIKGTRRKNTAWRLVKNLSSGWLVLSMAISSFGAPTPRSNSPKHTENKSPWVAVQQNDISYHFDYSWKTSWSVGAQTSHGGMAQWKQGNQTRYELGIQDKLKNMISLDKKLKTIVASWFLFDSMYALPGGAPASGIDMNIVSDITDLLVTQSLKGVQVAVVLDPLNRTYLDRVAPYVGTLRRNGVSIFYTDLTVTRPAFNPSKAEGAREKALMDALVTMNISHKLDRLYNRDRARKLLKKYSKRAGLSTGSQEDSSPLIMALFMGIPGGPQVDPNATGNPSVDMDRLFQKDELVIGGVEQKLDGETVGLEFAYNASLLKANHRKLLVTIGTDGSAEALVASANPHNASLPSENSALSVKGPLAKYIYNVIRADISQSIVKYNKWTKSSQKVAKAENKETLMRIARRYALFADQASPKDFLTRNIPAVGNPVDDPSKCRVQKAQGSWATSSHSEPVIPQTSHFACVRFVTESQISKQIMGLLNQAQPSDDIRIQMFYLSQKEIYVKLKFLIDQRADLLMQSNGNGENLGTIQLILDPNLFAFNSIKDGSPNRQVAHSLMLKAKGEKLASIFRIRWWDSTGEQNHAKVMSITNETKGKYEIITGSGNWTTKNIGQTHRDSPNFESDLVAVGAVSAVKSFNESFDRFWTNADQKLDRHYTVSYEEHPLKSPQPRDADWAAYMMKWTHGEDTGLVAW